MIELLNTSALLHCTGKLSASTCTVQSRNSVITGLLTISACCSVLAGSAAGPLLQARCSQGETEIAVARDCQLAPQCKGCLPAVVQHVACTDAACSFYSDLHAVQRHESTRRGNLASSTCITTNQEVGQRQRTAAFNV